MGRFKHRWVNEEERRREADAVWVYIDDEGNLIGYIGAGKRGCHFMMVASHSG